MNPKRSTLLTAAELVPVPQTRRGRGRPRTYRISEEVIGLTVYRLSMWGFPFRGPAGIYQVVIRVFGLRITADGIEKIYKRWLASERKRRDWRNWDGKGETALSPLPDRQRFIKSFLVGRRPRKRWSLQQYTEALLMNSGRWPIGEGRGYLYPGVYVSHGDALSPGAKKLEADWERRPGFLPRFIGKTGY